MSATLCCYSTHVFCVKGHFTYYVSKILLFANLSVAVKAVVATTQAYYCGNIFN